MLKVFQNDDLALILVIQEELKKPCSHALPARHQIRCAEARREKLLDIMDHLDPEDRHYDRKMNDMQDRLDALYDKFSALSDTAAETDK
ncbi:MAG: hypothetical protein PUJ06_04660 [Stecheria intestinalis]|nr:hypothetical protein [Stecheria intestinalis]